LNILEIPLCLALCALRRYTRDQQLATRALALICALKECVADRLNGTVLKDGTIMLNATSLSTPLHPEDLEGLFAAENKVLFCLETLRHCIYKAHKSGLLPPPVLGCMQNEDLYGVMKAYGECEKVVNQPPPGCIITHLKSTLMVYVCTLPFILVHEVGVWAVVPTTALLSLALFGTEAAAEQIEQPFGNRPYHLPVRSLINNNTRDLWQTSRPVLGFSGYVNSPREFSRDPEYMQVEQPVDFQAQVMGGSNGAATGPLLWRGLGPRV
jgi:predicted membrane chloride channel (bestrophin family)